MLTLVALVVLIVVYLSGQFMPFFSKATNGVALVPAFLLIFIIVLSVARAGYRKEADSQGLFTLLAVALKFLLPGALAVIWFEVLKNSADADILLFFIVYLSLSITAVLLIIRNLKNQN
jgi:hypothetical protein